MEKSIVKKKESNMTPKQIEDQIMEEKVQYLFDLAIFMAEEDKKKAKKNRVKSVPAEAECTDKKKKRFSLFH